jgi:hypothetical protein
MNTQQRITQAIINFVDRYPQPNLESQAAQDTLSQMVYQAVMKQSDWCGTYNDQQMELFSNNDHS